MENLTKETFIEKIFDFEDETKKEWSFNGELPTVIDFYADWCGPCKTISPILEELSTEYDGKVNIYKINVEDQQELAGMFNVRSIPSLLFIPSDNEPQMAMGAMSKDQLKEKIKDVLNVE